MRTVCMAASASPSPSDMPFKPTPPLFCKRNWSTFTLLPSPCNAAAVNICRTDIATEGMTEVCWSALSGAAQFLNYSMRHPLQCWGRQRKYGDAPRMEADRHRIRLCANENVCKRASGLPGRTFAVTNSTAGIAAGPDPFT